MIVSLRLARSATTDLAAIEASLGAEERAVLAARRATARGEAQGLDFLLGRAAARAAILDAGGASRERGITIVPDEAGAPVVTSIASSGRPAPSLSIGHRAGLAIAAAAPAEDGLAGLGVDVEPRAGARTAGVERMAVSPAEADALAAVRAAAGLDRAAALLALFCLKEAVMKAIGGGVFEGLREIDARGPWREPAVARLAGPTTIDARGLTPVRLAGRPAELAAAAGIGEVAAGWAIIVTDAGELEGLAALAVARRPADPMERGVDSTP